MKKALVIGVGPLNGLGAQLCKKIANNNFEVFVDESAEKIEAPAAAVKKESAPETSTQEEEEEDDLPF